MSSLNLLFSKIEELLHQQDLVIVTLDGRSGVGKSTTAALLAKKFGGVVIDTDGFYAGPPQGEENLWPTIPAEQRIKQVLDYQRLAREVLEPLLAGRVAHYLPFDFRIDPDKPAEAIEVSQVPVVIIDGVYSTKNLAKYSDVKVLLRYPDQARRERLIQREGAEFMQEWHPIWDEVEDLYFNQMMQDEDFDIILEGETDDG